MRDYLRHFPFLNPADLEALEALLQSRHLDKGAFLIKAGRVSNEVAFVREGLLRSYYQKADGEEVTYCFTFENQFMTAYASLITGEPTHENIQALVPTELWILTKPDMERLAQQSTNWLLFQKHMAEQHYLDLSNRLFTLQHETAAERYQTLIQNHPQYFQHIPLQQLASFLGITQRHLTRIRREIRFRTNVL